jgi:hypothetical protein
MAGSIELVHHAPHAARLARDVDVRRARFFQRQADKLAAPLDRWPVKKFVAHQQPPRSLGMAQLSNMIRRDGAAIVLVLLTAASSHGRLAPGPIMRKNCFGEFNFR